MGAYTLGELSALLISHVSRRRSHKAAHREFFHIFTHVDSYKSVGRVKQIFRELLCQMGFSDTGRPQEHESAYRLVGVLKSHPVTLNRFHNLLNGIILPDYSRFELRSHFTQPHALGLSYTLHRHTGHHGNNLSHLILVDGLGIFIQRSFPLAFRFLKLKLETMLFIAERCCALEVLSLRGFKLRRISLGDQLFHVFNLLRHHDIGDMDTRPRFIKGVDSLVGEIAIRHITISQFHTSLKSFGCIIDIMMLLILILYIIKYGKRLLGRCRFNHHFLESTFKRAVLLDVFAIFIDCCSTDALNLATRKRRLQKIGSIHRSGSVSRTYDGVELIDEKYYILITRQFIEDSLYTLLKLSTILRACHYRRHVKRDDTLVKQYARDFTLHNTQSKPFDNSRFSHTRLTYEHRIVLLATAQNLGKTLNLHLASHNRIKSSILGCTCHVIAIFIERGGVIATFGRR